MEGQRAAFMRLDQALVQRGLAASRTKAQEFVRAGRVLVEGQPLTRPSADVELGANIVVNGMQWVSRSALKLLGAIEQSGLQVCGRALDAGASTGGFTQVLLAHGAQKVYAIDVGHDQLAPQLRADARVIVREGLNLRDLRLSDVDSQPVDLLVCDVSFISLRLLVAPMLAVLRADGDALLMVKPQFEVGKDRLEAGGIVRDQTLRAEAIDGVLAAAAEQGWRPHWHADSALPGKDGNLEHFVWLRKMP